MWGIDSKRALYALVVLLSGCLQNEVRLIAADSTVEAGRAVLVYGVKVEGDWAYPAFGVQLAEYSVAYQSLLGNCAKFNRTEASVSTSLAQTKYFAFEVPPGHYVYSPFNGASMRQPSLAFLATEGRAVYVGDFVLTDANGVELRRDIESLRRAADAVPTTAYGPLLEAVTLQVGAPKPFLCAP